VKIRSRRGTSVKVDCKSDRKRTRINIIYKDI